MWWGGGYGWGISTVQVEGVRSGTGWSGKGRGVLGVVLLCRTCRPAGFVSTWSCLLMFISCLCLPRVHKTRAVVRFMFWNADDIRWFKPLELWTKGGRRGRITEPLGTHGAFKARFDGPVQQRDGVCLSLFKRVFPKWPARQLVAAGGSRAQQHAGAAGGGGSSSNEALDNCTFA